MAKPNEQQKAKESFDSLMLDLAEEQVIPFEFKNNNDSPRIEIFLASRMITLLDNGKYIVEEK